MQRYKSVYKEEKVEEQIGAGNVFHTVYQLLMDFEGDTRVAGEISDAINAAVSTYQRGNSGFNSQKFYRKLNSRL